MTARLTYHSRENIYSLSVNGKTIGRAETEQKLITIITQWAKERKVELQWQ